MKPNVPHDTYLNAGLGQLEIFEYGLNINQIIVPLLNILSIIMFHIRGCPCSQEPCVVAPKHQPLFFFFFLLFMAVPAAYRSSQARVRITSIATASATQGLSCIWDLHHSSWQHRLPDLLSKVRDWTCILMNTSQICFCCRHLFLNGSEEKLYVCMHVCIYVCMFISVYISIYK